MLANVLQLAAHLVGGLEAVRRIFLQCLHHRRDHVGGKGRRCRINRVWIVLQDLDDHRSRRVAFKRFFSRQHLVQHDASRENIRPAVDRFAAAHLFRRHVRRAAQDVALACERRRLELRDAEVEQLDLAILEDEHVVRLDVAMDDSLFVRVTQTVAELRHHIELVVDGQRRLGVHPGAERRPLEELHHDVRNVRFLGELEDRDDVPVIELGGGACFTVEARAHLLGVFGEVRVHQLDRDLAVEHRVEPAVQHPHPALADAFKDLIAANLLQLLRRGHE